MSEPTGYRLVLIDDEGRVFGSAMCSGLPRYVHMVSDAEGERWEGSDEPSPTEPVFHAETFARVGSAVWVDDGRDALFVRTA